MVYNNKKFLSRLKRLQLISGISLLLAISAAILFEYYMVVIILGAVLLLMCLLTRILNFNYVGIQIANGKLIIRYYALYAVDRSYESIEFPVGALRNVRVKKYLFGLKWDLYLAVKLKQGMASFPAVCLSAIPFGDRRELVDEIKGLIT
jgi:hypothetical protein